MPGLITDPAAIGIGITDVHITQRNQTLELFGIGKVDSEIRLPKTDFTYIKVADAMEGVAWRRQGT